MLKARQKAFKEMNALAKEPGANAIAGIDLDYETVGPHGGMLMVAVSGTAVTIRQVIVSQLLETGYI